jgi:hypothetical protein
LQCQSRWVQEKQCCLPSAMLFAVHCGLAVAVWVPRTALSTPAHMKACMIGHSVLVGADFATAACCSLRTYLVLKKRAGATAMPSKPGEGTGCAEQPRQVMPPQRTGFRAELRRPGTCLRHLGVTKPCRDTATMSARPFLASCMTRCG